MRDTPAPRPYHSARKRYIIGEKNDPADYRAPRGLFSWGKTSPEVSRKRLMGKKKKINKDHPIPCDYLAPERSRRPEILYEALRPHLAPGESYLDVTCGYAVLADFVIPNHEPAAYTGFDMNEKVIDYCRARHPSGTWGVSLSRNFSIETRYDVVFHIGVSSIRYNVHEIHRRICERPEGLPRLVLVEHGATETGDDDTGLTYAAIGEIYAGHGFDTADEGEFHTEDIPYPIRRWMILVRSKPTHID